MQLRVRSNKISHTDVSNSIELNLFQTKCSTYCDASKPKGLSKWKTYLDSAEC